MGCLGLGRGRRAHLRAGGTWLRLDLDLLVLIAWLVAMVVLVFVKYGAALFA